MDNKKDKRGFAGLSDLASDISTDELNIAPPPSSPPQSSKCKTQTGETGKDGQDPAAGINGKSAGKRGSKTKWIWILSLIALIIWNALGTDNKQSAKKQPVIKTQRENKGTTSAPSKTSAPLTAKQPKKITPAVKEEDKEFIEGQYRCLMSHSLKLNLLRPVISKKNQITILQEKLDLESQILEENFASINTAKDSLEKHQKRVDAMFVNKYSQESINKYNNAVDQYNNKRESYMVDVSTYQTRMDSYNDNMQGYNNMLAAYNNQVRVYNQYLKANCTEAY